MFPLSDCHSGVSSAWSARYGVESGVVQLVDATVGTDEEVFARDDERSGVGVRLAEIGIDRCFLVSGELIAAARADQANDHALVVSGGFPVPGNVKVWAATDDGVGFIVCRNSIVCRGLTAAIERIPVLIRGDAPGNPAIAVWRNREDANHLLAGAGELDQRGPDDVVVRRVVGREQDSLGQANIGLDRREPVVRPSL